MKTLRGFVKILIRTDLGQHHGMGHAVRMLALARQLAAAGAEVSFVTSTPALQGYVVPFRCVMRGGYWPQVPDVYVLDTKAMDDANDDRLLAQMRIHEPQSVFDSSHRPGSEHLKIVRIDHPAATPESCDLLIGPCAHWHEATVARLQRSFGDRFLYGWNYVMLDPRVTELPPVPRTGNSVRPIVFTAGGSDPTGALQRMYDWTITYSTETPLAFLVGSQSQMLNPRVGVSRAGCPVVASFDRSWIRSAGYLVTLFGVTCYEALWWQVPQSIFSHTPENAEAGAQLERMTEGCCRYQGDMTAHSATSLCEILRRSLSPYRTTPCGDTPLAWVLDGRGLTRVAQAILALT